MNTNCFIIIALCICITCRDPLIIIHHMATINMPSQSFQAIPCFPFGKFCFHTPYSVYAFLHIIHDCVSLSFYLKSEHNNLLFVVFAQILKNSIYLLNKLFFRIFPSSLPYAAVRYLRCCYLLLSPIRIALAIIFNNLFFFFFFLSYSWFSLVVITFHSYIL